MRRLMIATHNKGKLEELIALLKELGFDPITPAELNISLQVTEDGQSYSENASKKAAAYAKASALISLGDDSGLEVDALGGAPGLHSARYVPQANATDAQRRAHLLANLCGIPRPWTARFRAAIAVADPIGNVYCTEGECAGEIIPEERGRGGFGYDPIFLVETSGHTMAELDLESKNRISHRAKALYKAKNFLDKLIAP
jgi:XTP/dITP diphosphohydrolase